MPDTGSAPNKTFQRTDGTRTGPETWQEAEAAVVGIESDDHDTHDQDIANAISNRLMLDGGNQPSAAIPWNNQRITGYGVPSARTDAQRVDKVQDSAHTYAGTSAGTDTITATLSPAITAYAAGQRFTFLAGGTNTGAATINFNAVGAGALKKGPDGATALAPGDITAAGLYTVEYDGTIFQLLNPKTPVGYIVGTDIQAFDELLAEIAALSTDPNADSGLFFDDSAGNIAYWTPTGALSFSGTTLVVADSSDSAKGAIEIATAAEVTSASSTTLAVTPGRQHAHPGHPKAWTSFEQTGTHGANQAHGVSSYTDDGVGVTTLTWSTAFAAATYSWQATSRGASVGDDHTTVSAPAAATKSTTQLAITVLDVPSDTVDSNDVNVAVWGAQ